MISQGRRRVDGEGIAARHDVGLHVAKSAGSGNGIEIRADLELPWGLDHTAIGSLKVACIGHE